jgi:stearoyl-CoA desaturase (delta-9 desaturase)
MELAPLIGAAVAIWVASIHGRPAHAIFTFWLMAIATGLGLTVGYHRLFAHRAFNTSRLIERALMILGCMAGSSPFFWIATHRTHHRYSDQKGDPHTPHAWTGQRLGRLRGFWHAYFEWLHSSGYVYEGSAIRDLTRRRDLVQIDRHWLVWYMLGLAIPSVIGGLVGGTAYDALIGFLWGGLLRSFIVLQIPLAINAVCHLWGSRPYDTPDESRNNALLGVLAMGEGWHNNHHAFPSSARHGFYWWQLDLTWGVIWLMERFGLAWDVRRPHPLAYTRPAELVDDRRDGALQ